MNSGGSIILSVLRISKSKKRDYKLSSPLSRYTLARDMTPMNKFSRSYLFRFTISQSRQILQFLGQDLHTIPHFRYSPFQRFPVLEIPPFRNSPFQRFPLLEIPRFRDSPFQRFPVLEIALFRDCPFQRFPVLEIPHSPFPVPHSPFLHFPFLILELEIPRFRDSSFQRFPIPRYPFPIPPFPVPCFRTSPTSCSGFSYGKQKAAIVYIFCASICIKTRDSGYLHNVIYVEAGFSYTHQCYLIIFTTWQF